MTFLPSRTERRSARPSVDPAREQVAALVALTYELLDAHADTARLARDQANDAGWQNHLAYLRDLQRVARGMLAHATAETDPPSPLRPRR
jgi:hypothetical protein